MNAPTERPSPNHNARPEGVAIDMLILHYTGMVSGEAALERLCDSEAKVSSHYLVEEDGAVFRLVPEDRRAWHAGVSYWAGETDINGRSIGVEIVNPGHEFGYRPFPGAQMAAVTDLCLDILSRHPIPPQRVLGHSDVAPDRKQDPGELFDWRGLADAGIGVWPKNNEGAAPSLETVRELLTAIGYNPVLPLDVVVSAFQRHFRPGRVDGVPDEETMALLAVCAAMS